MFLYHQRCKASFKQLVNNDWKNLPSEVINCSTMDILVWGFSVWDCCGRTEINQMVKLKQRAARIITGSHFNALSLPLVKRLGWKTIDELIRNESNIMVLKSLHVLAPQFICNVFTKTSQLTSRDLRNLETDLRIPKIKSTIGQKCFSFQGTKSWNGLSAERKKASTLCAFKKLEGLFFNSKICRMDIWYFGVSDCPNLKANGCLSCNPV